MINYDNFENCILLVQRQYLLDKEFTKDIKPFLLNTIVRNENHITLIERILYSIFSDYKIGDLYNFLKSNNGVRSFYDTLTKNVTQPTPVQVSISKEHFYEIIAEMENLKKFEYSFVDIIQKYFTDDRIFIGYNFSQINSAIFELIKFEFNDIGEWLDYFVYDCNYGECPILELVNGEEVDIKKENFYDFLILNFKNNSENNLHYVKKNRIPLSEEDFKNIFK